MGSGNNQCPTITGTNIIQRQKNVQIATIKPVIMIPKAGAIHLIVTTRMQPHMVPLMDNRKKIHPDMQTVVIHVTLDKFDPVGIVDQRLKTRTPFYNIPETHTVAVVTFVPHSMHIAQPFLSSVAQHKPFIDLFIDLGNEVPAETAFSRMRKPSRSKQ